MDDFYSQRERERKESPPRGCGHRHIERRCVRPGKEGRKGISKRSKDLSLRVQRTSHLKVVVLVRPHPPREEEEKIVQVAVLRATCRSMMMMTVLDIGGGGGGLGKSKSE